MNMQRTKNRGMGALTIAFSASTVAFGIGGSGHSSANAALLPLTSFPSANDYINFVSTPAPASLPTGNVVYSEVTPFTLGILMGTISTTVYDDTPTSNTLDFVYKVTNANSVDPIKELTLSVIGSAVTTNVGYVTGAPATVDPTSADRQFGNIDWYFPDPNSISAGSDMLIVQTNSTTWSDGNGAVIDGSTANADVQVPGAGTTVPEPASLGLIAAGAGLLLRRRRA